MDLLCFCSVLCLQCLCAHLFICALWSPAGKGLTSWLSFVVSYCECVTFPLVYSVQIRDVGRFLAKFNPWTNTFGNRLVRLHCSRIHPSVKLSTLWSYSCRIVENKLFELLKMNLLSPDTLFEICTCMYLKHVRVSKTIQPKYQSSTMKSTITHVLLFYKRYMHPFPVIHLLNP